MVAFVHDTRTGVASALDRRLGGSVLDNPRVAAWTRGRGGLVTTIDDLFGGKCDRFANEHPVGLTSRSKDTVAY